MSLTRHALSIACLMAASAFALVLVPRPAAADLIGVATGETGPGAIYSVNQATGAATLLTSTPGTRPSFVGAEFRQGVLYVSDVDFNGDFVLGTYDLITGAFTQISNQSTFISLMGLAYRPSNDLFYSVDLLPDRPLVTIHPITGAVTTIGNTNNGGILGLAFDQANDILYGVTLTAASAIDLVTINPSSGVVTSIGATGQTASNTLAGLAFDEDNDILYMNLGISNSSPNSLFTVNTATGAATLVGSNGAVIGNGIDGLAWRATASAAAPEPGAFALLALSGLPLVGVVVRRCRRSV